ncbi:MAG: O-methyltransferase [Clostridia bacterium]
MNLEKLEEVKIKALENHVPILMDESLELIETILAAVKPKRILEVGTAVGYSSMKFTKYLQEGGKIDTIEISDKMLDIATKNIKECGADHLINVIFADATEYMKTMTNEKEYDVVFIDAAKGQYNVYLEEGLRLLKNGGVIIADNVLFKGRVLSDYNDHKHRTAVNRLRLFIKNIKENENLTSTVLDVGDGVAICVKK